MSKKAEERWVDNPGYQPKETRGKRVRVELEHGGEPIYDDHFNPMSPPGWAADGKGGCNWTKSDPPFAFDIKRYLVL
jgi:hypothetical protein